MAGSSKVILAAVLVIAAMSCHAVSCDDSNNGLPQKVADLQTLTAAQQQLINTLQNQAAAQQQLITALQTQVSGLQSQLTALGTQVASFYNAGDNSITATAFKLSTGWIIHNEGPFFVIRQATSNVAYNPTTGAYTPDYRYALFPNMYVDVKSYYGKRL